jgi:hypothetical protein
MEAMNSISRLPLFIGTALEKVPSIYYRAYPHCKTTLGSCTPRSTEQKEIAAYLRRHHERVFCYELYHQLRVLMDHDTSGLFNGVHLQSELNKPQISDALQGFFGISSLDKAFIPDFLLHSPADADHQELVMEVKCDPCLTLEAARQDLEKVQQFMTRYRYRVGVFLTVNTDEKTMSRMLDNTEHREWLRGQPDACRIFWIWKKGPEDRARAWTIVSDWRNESLAI